MATFGEQCTPCLSHVRTLDSRTIPPACQAANPTYWAHSVRRNNILCDLGTAGPIARHAARMTVLRGGPCELLLLSPKPPTCASLGEVFPGKEGSHQGSNLREQEVVLWFGRSCVLIDAVPNQ